LQQRHFEHAGNLLGPFKGDNMTTRALALIALLVLSGCSTAIRGTVQLVDARQQPIANDTPKGAVVNMINTKAAVE